MDPYTRSPPARSTPHDGVTLGARVEAGRTVGPWLLGGGVSETYATTSRYEKRVFHPYILTGFKVRDGCTITTRFFLPQGDNRDGLLGPEVWADFPFRHRQRFGFRVGMSVFSSYPTDVPLGGRQSFAQAEAGITWRLR